MVGSQYISIGREVTKYKTRRYCVYRKHAQGGEGGGARDRSYVFPESQAPAHRLEGRRVPEPSATPAVCADASIFIFHLPCTYRRYQYITLQLLVATSPPLLPVPRRAAPPVFLALPHSHTMQTKQREGRYWLGSESLVSVFLVTHTVAHAIGLGRSPPYRPPLLAVPTVLACCRCQLGGHACRRHRPG